MVKSNGIKAMREKSSIQRCACQVGNRAEHMASSVTRLNQAGMPQASGAVEVKP